MALFGRKKKEKKIIVKNGKDWKGNKDIRVYPDLLSIRGIEKDQGHTEKEGKTPAKL